MFSRDTVRFAGYLAAVGAVLAVVGMATLLYLAVRPFL